MTANVPAVVALCAGAGFLVVWIVFPGKRTATSSNPGEGANTTDNSSADARQDEPQRQSTDSGVRPRWCDILLLEPDASPAAIRKAYARLMKGLHPDSNGGDENTTRQCALVQNAY